MAYSNSNGSDRIDDRRFRTQQSPRNENNSLMGLVSPPRNSTRLPQPVQSQDTRGGLMRRFTTDSGRVPTMASLVPSRGGQENQEFGPPSLEKKKLEYERLREQKRRFEAEMQLLDLQQRREEQELVQMQEDLGRNGNTIGGHQSEPTTPPEYRETPSGFPSVFSRPNRYSTSSIVSPPGLYGRAGRSGSQLTSPQSSILQSRLLMDDKLPSKSVPGSRRNSDEDEKEEAVRQDPTSHRSTNAYSMPVTRSRNGMHELLSIDQNDTTRFLFGEEESATASDIKSYLSMNATDDNFPILVRQDKYPGILSASSAALDLALSQSPGPEGAKLNAWGSSFARHRPSQQSLPMNTLQENGSPLGAPANGPESPLSVRPFNRHSLDLKYLEGSQETSPQFTSPTSKLAQTTPPKLQSSYSANDVPTMRSATSGANANNTTPNSHAQQHLHNHNASLGRIPPNAVNNRLSRELPSGDSSPLRENQNGGYQSIQSALQASAPAFGPGLNQGLSQGLNQGLHQGLSQGLNQGLPQGMSQGLSQAQVASGMTSPTAQFNAPGYYPQNNYNMHLVTMGFQNMQVAQPVGQQGYSPNNPYVGYPNMYPQNGGVRDSQARVIQQRRQNDGDAMNRFANMPLEQLGGEIYTLCKDQHGCRYLQKKLEDRNPEQVHMIWLETNQHVIELMTDPFGNYLCQKLLEYCNDDERTVLIENASHDLVRIALNQHGTRALQKMIEFISTPGQVQTIINALRFRVVELIQDLNGNHVIQKCLNKLSPVDAQFIFDAVGHHCVEVGTHRHGCCVLQRCIDHASGEQKAWLIRQISNNAYILVQDPFGNYVVQYILDLNEPIFTEPLVGMFQGRVGQLSKQKFSSNVIEKCLRCAQEPSKDMLIEEMLQPSELDRLLRDSFANYVIQTALDYANPAMKNRLIEAIRPYLPAIRTTPYGRRIQAKISGNEARTSAPTSGQQTPNDVESTQIPVRHQRAMSNASTGGFASPVSPFSNGNGYPANGHMNGHANGQSNMSSAGARPSIQPANFSPADQNGSPAQQGFSPYAYGRGSGAQSGPNNWL